MSPYQQLDESVTKQFNDSIAHGMTLGEFLDDRYVRFQTR